MQTFITSHDMKENASNLDMKRLGKQRVEALQIIKENLGITKGWQHHPIVKMWKGYEPYLLKVYLKSIMDEWEARGYKNIKCKDQFKAFMEIFKADDPVKPPWITDELILSHQSNLVRKKPEHYTKLFPDIPDNLPYIWTK